MGRMTLCHEGRRSDGQGRRRVADGPSRSGGSISGSPHDARSHEFEVPRPLELRARACLVLLPLALVVNETLVTAQRGSEPPVGKWPGTSEPGEHQVHALAVERLRLGLVGGSNQASEVGGDGKVTSGQRARRSGSWPRSSVAADARPPPPT